MARVNSLENPPGGVRAEFVPAAVVEFLCGANETDVLPS
jgi:hypothetical protein